MGAMSALTEAITAGDLDGVTAILEQHPDALAQPENGITPLLLSIYYGKLEVTRLLLERGAPVSFAEACALGDEARAKTLLTADPSLLEMRTADGFPPLGLAIFFRRPALAKWLIESGADVNAAATNAQKVTPLHAAAAVCDQETVALLLARGADVHAKQQLDYTPLHGAASRGDVAVARLLLAHGAARDPRGSDGMTPADIARKYGKPEFAEWIGSAQENEESGDRRGER